VKALRFVQHVQQQQGEGSPKRPKIHFSDIRYVHGIGLLIEVNF